MLRWFPKSGRLLALGLSVVAVFGAAAVATIAIHPAQAQSSSPSDILNSLPPGTLQNLPPDVLQKLRARGLGGIIGPSDQSGAQPPVVQTFEPAAPPSPPAEQSRLEAIYSLRAGQPLTQFGYSVLGAPATVSVLQSGGIQDDYVLGVGDELEFDLRGQENASYQQSIDTSGRIVLPKLAPVLAAGRTFGEFRRDVEDRVAKAYVSTKVSISLTSVRQAQVLVTGSVRTPGMRIVSGLSTPLDAILLSGGITRRGSLRDVKLIRDGETRTLDLYSVIAQGSNSHIGRLRDGDRIFVPQLGSTVAVSGSVRRPAIYELPAGSSAISVRSLLALAGGVEIRGSYRLLLLRTRPDGKQELGDVTSQEGAAVRDGELLVVQSAVNEAVGQVQLDGDVKVPGQYALSHVKTLHDLLPSSDVLGEDPYLLLGVILREDRTTLHRIVVPFSPLHVLQGKENVDLMSKDEVHILTVDEMRGIAATILSPAEAAAAAAAAASGNGPSGSVAPPPAPQPFVAPGTQGGAPNANGVSSLFNPAALGSIPSLNATNGAGAPMGGAAAAQPQTGATSYGGVSPGVTSFGAASSGATAIAGTSGASGGMGAFSVADQAFIGHVISEYAVVLSGAVRDPGVYLVMPGTSLDELVLAANGLDRDVDLSSVEITSRNVDNDTGLSQTTRRTIAGTPEHLRETMIGKYDQVVFRHVFSDLEGGQVSLNGEFRYPGTYGILRGEHLSSAISRAGGLTEVAYPYGAVFTRPSVAAAERKGFDRAARELQEQLAILAATPAETSTVQPGNLQFLATMAIDLKNTPAVGRVAIVSDPVVLAMKPELDPILESGDAIYMPKRPTSITVSGEVLNPGSFMFQSHLGYQDYIRMSGGDTQFADADSTFVVLPDGSASPVNQNWLTFGNGGHIPPGSTIVVPRDLRPFDWSIFIKDASQIFSQLAVATASLVVVTRNGN